jgi:hypothetical protein
MNKLVIGAIVRTSYGTGPYVIRHVSGPEVGERKIGQFNMMLHGYGCGVGEYFLNGYRQDGTHCRTKDFLIFEGFEPNCNADLFSEFATC